MKARHHENFRPTEKNSRLSWNAPLQTASRRKIVVPQPQAQDPALAGGDARLTDTGLWLVVTAAARSGGRGLCLGQMARGGRKENSVADEPQTAPAGEANGSFRLASQPPAAPREHLLSRAPSARRPKGRGHRDQISCRPGLFVYCSRRRRGIRGHSPIRGKVA